MTITKLKINRTDDPPTIRDASGNSVAVKVESSDESPVRARLHCAMMYGDCWVREVDGETVEVFRPVEVDDE